MAIFSYILYISLMIQITFMAVTAKKEIKVNMAYKVNISNADLSTELIEWLQADGVTRPFEDDVKRYYG